MSTDDESDYDYSEDNSDYYTIENYDNDLGNTADVDDPEYYFVEFVEKENVVDMFNKLAADVRKSISVEQDVAKMLLFKNNWDVNTVIAKYHHDFKHTAKPAGIFTASIDANMKLCNVCIGTVEARNIKSLSCKHEFCTSCWSFYVTTRIQNGAGIEISCMESNCDVIAPENFVLKLPLTTQLVDQYKRFVFESYVKAHPLLEFCISPNCNTIFKVKERMAKKVICPACKVSFCFGCGLEYHAPADCITIKNWLTKCRDDSETANYFSTHTKDCPNCNICIEKNGGCNHMQCYKCRHDFCWVCLGDWKTHGAEYYECSRYKQDQKSITEIAKAREALKKYLHYYERWENHAKSLLLEEQTKERIKTRINEKVMNCSGTWIDWQYLLDAAALLAKCRYTLQYTYPYAYYMTPEMGKDLFEYQQARLEVEIEDLSWKIERAETTDRGELENQMYIAEKMRQTLLKKFFNT